MVKTLGFNTEWFEETTVEEVRAYFKNRVLLQYDSETTGMDPYTTPMVCFQLGDYDNQFVISPEYLPHFKDMLESKTLIGHNIKFDLRFLYHHDIFPTSVFDTFLAEGVLYCGIKTHKKGLDKVALDRIGVTLDKSIRIGIGKHDMTKEEIQYSADDVKWLELIKDNQELELTEKQLHVALKIENNFVLVLAYIEYSGFQLDVEAWKRKMAKDKIAAENTRIELDNFIMDNNFFEYIKVKADDLFEAGSRKPNLNWDSPKQVAELFKKLGIPVDIIEKGKEKESVGAKAIGKYKKQFPIVATYLRYKEEMKVVGTYGQNFIDQINPVSGRLHTNYWQIQDTARISSGGKDKANGVEYLNFQNIPADDETRHCFVSRPGYSLIDADFSGQEQVVLANKSLDPSLLKFYDEGFSDMHSFTAYNMYAEIREAVGPITKEAFKRIKEEFKKLRNSAKSAGFAINYGGNENTIAVNENIPLEDARNIYTKYFEAFPGLNPYFKKVKEQGLRDGYILFNDKTMRKSYVDHYDKYLQLKQEINRAFWDKWKPLKAAELKRKETMAAGFSVGDPDPNYVEMKEKISDFFKIQGTIERKSLNYPIQGTSAEITKMSAILIFKWIREHNLFKIVWFPNQVHDENILEAPDEMAKEVADVVADCMKKAGAWYYTRVPLSADAVITKIWQH